MRGRVSCQRRGSISRVFGWGVLRSFAGVVALAALLAGCAQTTAAAAPKATASPTSTPTLTPLPPAPLQWKHVPLPTASDTDTAYAIAPSNGAVVYACAPPHRLDDQIAWPRVWVTHDFAAHWSQMASIPADHKNNGCIVQVDQLNPSIAVAVLTWMPLGAGSLSINDMTNYVTFNGGASWRKLTNPQPFEMDVLNGPATRNGVTYAIRGILSGNAVHQGLWVSSDHMTTWRLIDPPGVTADAATVWVQPTTGEVLAQYGEPGGPTDLWDSRDGGAHWSRITAPTLVTPSSSRYPYLAVPASAQAGWTICDSIVRVTDTAYDDSLMCSKDGGMTWVTLPSITPDRTGANSWYWTATVYGIASDGAILAVLTTDTTNELYRLAPSAQQWQPVGDLPAAMGYSSISSGNVIWWTSMPLSPIIATTHG